MQPVAEEALDRCMRSVVLIRDNTDLDAYCTGCVIKSNVILGSGNKTLIITSSEFVQGREHNMNVLFAWGLRFLGYMSHFLCCLSISIVNVMLLT